MDSRHVVASGYRYHCRRARCWLGYSLRTHPGSSTLDLYVRRHTCCGQGDRERVGHTGASNEWAARGKDADTGGSSHFLLVRLGGLPTENTGLPTMSISHSMPVQTESSGISLAPPGARHVPRMTLYGQGTLLLSGM